MLKTITTEDYEGPPRRSRDDSWHLDKKTLLGLIFSLIGLTVSGFSAWRQLTTDVELIKQEQKTLASIDNRMIAEHQASLNTINAQLVAMGLRMDKLFDILLDMQKERNRK